MENLITFSEETFTDIETEIRKDFAETHDIKSALEAFCRRHSDYDERDDWKDGILLNTLSKKRYLLVDVHDDNLRGIRVKLVGDKLDIKLLSDFQFDVEDQLIREIIIDKDMPMKEKLARVSYLPMLIAVVTYGIGLCLYVSYGFFGGFSWYSMLLPLLFSIPAGGLFLWMLLGVGGGAAIFFRIAMFQLPIYGVCAAAIRYLLLSNFLGDASFLTATALLIAIPVHVAAELLLGCTLFAVFKDKIMIISDPPEAFE